MTGRGRHRWLAGPLLGAALALSGCDRDALPTPGCTTRGIDVSRHQDVIDWAAVSRGGIGFAWMKANGSKAVPLGGALWDGGAETFVHRGVNGRWRDRLSAAESRRYESLAVEKLGAACAHWLATGEREMPEAMPVEAPLPRAA